MDPVAKHVYDLMKAAKVTENEAKAFMGEALCRSERDKFGAASAFLKELIERRRQR